MPYIFKGEKKHKPLTDKKRLRQRLYNNKKWKRLRNGYLMEHPTCEVCGEVATDVHHLNSPFDDGLNDVERLGRLLDVNNFQALCQRCHGLLHTRKK